jgi:hypothetical protein
MSIKISNLGGIKIAIEKLSKDAIDELEKTLPECGEIIATRATALAPKGGEGNLLFKSTTSQIEDYLKVSVTNPVFYAPFMEFGTKGKFDANGRQAIAAQFKGRGKGGSFDNMVKDIAQWLQRKGFYPPNIRGEKAKMSYAKYVAGKIAKGGVKPQPFFYRAYDEVLPEIRRKIKDILK